MEAKMSMILHTTKLKLTKDKLLSFHLRIIINRERFDTSVNRYVSEEKRSAQEGRVKRIFGGHNDQPLAALTGKTHSTERDIY